MTYRALLTLLVTLNAGLFSLGAAAAGDAEAGGKLFTKTCGGCHSIGENARSGFGPHLNGVIGRQAGSLPGYQFSQAMKNSGVIWTPETLAAYIEAPKKVVKGTRMIFWGISDPEKIANLLAYIETFKDQ
ncbi:c-type cytochrome [Pseudomonas helleri]|uniref:C-type cytochrome n=1 Tax=Pseudomonas helleri TaxID=1608996 RepID=A0A6L5HVE1_9PSED|nr:cytochrome c family protein [Pseudomonas helleri]MQU07364.1 c-type cytochrome [Pseudomonas helleri]